MVGFQLLLERKTKLIRNAAIFFTHLVYDSLYPLQYTLFRHWQILMFTLKKNLSPLWQVKELEMRRGDGREKALIPGVGLQCFMYPRIWPL